MIVNRRGETLRQYLTSRVVPGNNGCWIWKGSSPGRYGSAEFCNTSKPAHIASYECFNGDVEEGKIIRHKCDNPRCINPLHLEIGTKKDNRKDFMERHPKAKEICLKASKIGAKGVKKFWDSMSPEERKEFCIKRNQKQMEKYPNWAPRKGKKESEESKMKRSAMMIGNQHAKGHISPNKGKTWKDPEETKIKKRESAIKAWEKRRSL